MYILYAFAIMKLVRLILYILFQIWCHRKPKSKRIVKTEKENLDLLLTGLLKEEVHFQFTKEFIDSMENAKNAFNDLGKSIRDNVGPAINKFSVESNGLYKNAAEVFSSPSINSKNHAAYSNKEKKLNKLPITSVYINKETDKDDRL